MAKEFYIIDKKNIPEFIEKLQYDNDIFMLTEGLLYQKYSQGCDMHNVNLDTVRAMHPVKLFFFYNNELVHKDPVQSRKKVILGVKNCDLKALAVLDKIFLTSGDVIDPFYKQSRDNTIIVSSDCNEPGKNCFCTMVGNKPYADAGFDLNFSISHNNYVVEIGSEKGEKLIKLYPTIFHRLSDDNKLKGRDKDRDNAIKKIADINKEFAKLFGENLQDIVKKNFNSNKWKEESVNCVQCAGCNNICPSCYCFFLSEEKDASRIRFWDACHNTGYARVAGGANARPKLYERFRNRYQCKFNYRKTNFNVYSCTGCGRCIEVCPGKIDIRKVINTL